MPEKARDDLPIAAVEAAARAIERFGWPYKSKSRGVARVMLTAAIPHLGADEQVRDAVVSFVRSGATMQRDGTTGAP